MEKLLEFKNNHLYLDNIDLNNIFDIKESIYFFDIVEAYMIYRKEIINRNFKIERIINKEYIKKEDKVVLEEHINLYVPNNIYNYMKFRIFDCAYFFLNENIDSKYVIGTLDRTISNYFLNNYKKYAYIKRNSNGCSIKIGDMFSEEDYQKKLIMIK